MRTLKRKGNFQRAERILEEFKKDQYFIDRLKGLHPNCRVKYFLREFPGVVRLNNLEKNWLLYEVSKKVVSLNICPFYRFSEWDNKQYCHPECLEENKTDLVLKINSSGINYSFEELECNCDLTNGCKKREILT